MGRDRPRSGSSDARLECYLSSLPYQVGAATYVREKTRTYSLYEQCSRKIA